MENIKNIIFDYGNVIFSLSFTSVQQAWNQLGISNPETFFGHKTQDEIFDKFDRGEVTAAQFRDYVRKKTSNPSHTSSKCPSTRCTACLFFFTCGCADLSPGSGGPWGDF
jgi:putative hydrolase of the HAD superfamily